MNEELTPRRRANQIIDWVRKQANARDKEDPDSQAYFWEMFAEHLTLQIIEAAAVAKSPKVQRANAVVAETTRTKAATLVNDWLGDVEANAATRNGPSAKAIVNGLRSCGGVANLVASLNALLVDQFDLFLMYSEALIRCGAVVDDKNVCQYCDTSLDNGNEHGTACPWGDLERLIKKGKV